MSRKLTRKGNLPGLMKAIPKNYKMSRTTKAKAIRGVQRKARRLHIKLPTPHRPRPRRYHWRQNRRYHGQGMEGLREASIASAKLLSKPLDTAIEGFHVANGFRKMYLAVKRWWYRL